MKILEPTDRNIVVLFVLVSLVATAIVISLFVPQEETIGSDANQLDNSGAVAKAPDAALPEPLSYASPDLSGFSEVPATGQVTKVTMPDRQGRERYALVSVPADYTPDRKWPVVLGLGGWTNSPEVFRGYSKLDESEMGKEAFIVYAQGIGNAWFGPPYAVTKRGEDNGFLVDLLARVAKTFSIDEMNINAVGMSNGGGMAMQLACQNPGLLHGIVTVSGAFYAPVFDGCVGAPVRSLVVHSATDELMLYDGGQAHGAEVKSVDFAMGNLTGMNGCDKDVFDESNITERFGGEVVIQRVYKNCKKHVELWTLPEDRHTWFLDPNMAVESWNFLKA
ncbi:alpha/beta hydrolase family esterase [Corynebacterium anserum]|uniref:Uncharacterized protein n=1 Tax=Corynebacterium anserum TaxID=2684406 RepID=A0A7G7YP02_9CORY|nr:alpha/beta hydrolase-fold protein [Corynebacterium anserum]MBC2681823.1 hypothetical protein [Corynebacterium anserum]QNH96222.1 hypothetical protein GP473_05720 [Corynebacterium anserum]